MNIILVERLYQRWIVQRKINDNVYKELQKAIDDYIDSISFPFDVASFKKMFFEISIEAILRCFIDQAFFETTQVDEGGEAHKEIQEDILIPYILFVAVKHMGKEVLNDSKFLFDLLKTASIMTAILGVTLNKHLED